MKNDNNKEFKNVSNDLTPKQETTLSKIISLMEENDIEIVDVTEGMGY
jgi:hypothetical protein